MTTTMTTDRQCQHLVLRNGYWTGRCCSRRAVMLVDLAGICMDVTVKAHHAGEAFLCAQHGKGRTPKETS